MTENIRLAVVVGSVREGRFGPVVAEWFAARARLRPELSVDVVDLIDTGLDGAFAERVGLADALVVVTPEYNHSFPGPLKTAIDATSGQLRDKPVGFVAYGGMSGGLRAVEQLRPVLAELHAVGLRDTVSFHGAAGAFDGSGRPREEGEKEAAAAVLLDALVWWARTLRRARDEHTVGEPDVSDHPRPYPGQELSVGEVAERSGVPVSALHFYEREGLISSRRTSGNQRRFRREVLRRLSFIRIAQRVGIPLAEIRDSLDSLPDGRTPNRKDWERLSAQWREELDDRIRRLEQLRDDFSGCIGCGCLSIDRCGLVNPHDRLGEDGPGPRRLVG